MTDPIETRLLDLENAIVTAWKRSESDSVLGELAALAAAVRQFYQESQRSEDTSAARRPSVPCPVCGEAKDDIVHGRSECNQNVHWSHEWQRQWLRPR